MTNAMRATEEGDDDWPIYIDKELSLSQFHRSQDIYTLRNFVFFAQPIMPFSKEEAAPLVKGTRRRWRPQKQTPAFEQSMYSLDESTKTHRRSRLNRCCSKLSDVCCSGPTKDIQAEYYEDTFNDEPWDCTCGTGEGDGIWTNYGDRVGSVMSSMVFLLMTYSIVTISFLAQHNDIPSHIAMIYTTICSLAMASHAKTMLTDPGSIPQEAVPLATLFKKGVTTHAMCSHCQTYKPPNSHHCRICNRCISRMDHHCPWMNNCVGANNFKHFILFLSYTWIACVFALLLFGVNYFFCNNYNCMFSGTLVLLVRVMTVLALGTLVFVSSMLLNVIYGIMTGIGTIDRLKKKANGTLLDAVNEPIPLKDVFGIQGYWTWLLPIDPVFEDYDKVMGFSIPQRLMRERLHEI